MSVAEVVKAAGLTHGALYSHFKSKEALQAAAIERAFSDCLADFADLSSEQFLTQYLSTQHRDNAGQGCPTAALVSEVRWQSEEARTVFYDGILRFAALADSSLGLDDADDMRGFTMLAFAAMAGSLAISRAIKDINEVKSDAVLQIVADQLRQVMTIAAGHSKPKKSNRKRQVADPP